MVAVGAELVAHRGRRRGEPAQRQPPSAAGCRRARRSADCTAPAAARAAANGRGAGRAAAAARRPQPAVATRHAGRAPASPRRRCAGARGSSASICATCPAPGRTAASRTPTSTPIVARRRAARAPRRAPARRAGSHGDRGRSRSIGLRRQIAEKMQDAKRRIPHFTYVEEVDITELEALRAHLNATHARASGRKLTLLPFLMRAHGAGACASFPQLNAHFDDDAGVDDALRGGAPRHRHADRRRPVVPVVRHAEALDLWASAAEMRRAHRGRPQRQGRRATSSPARRSPSPASARWAASPRRRSSTTPRWRSSASTRSSSGRWSTTARSCARKMMNLSSSFDHRVVDGGRGASSCRRCAPGWKTPGCCSPADPKRQAAITRRRAARAASRTPCAGRAARADREKLRAAWRSRPGSRGGRRC